MTLYGFIWRLALTLLFFPLLILIAFVYYGGKMVWEVELKTFPSHVRKAWSLVKK